MSRRCWYPYALAMQNMNQALAPDLQAVNEFWAQASDKINVHSDSALFGEQSEAGLFPPAFQFSDNRAEATLMAHEVLNGSRTSFSTPLHDFTDQGLALPALGDLSIICDGDGKPVALISDTDVQTEAKGSNPNHKVVVETFTVLFRW